MECIISLDDDAVIIHLLFSCGLSTHNKHDDDDDDGLEFTTEQSP